MSGRLETSLTHAPASGDKGSHDEHGNAEEEEDLIDLNSVAPSVSGQSDTQAEAADNINDKQQILPHPSPTTLFRSHSNDSIFQTVNTNTLIGSTQDTHADHLTIHTPPLQDPQPSRHTSQPLPPKDTAKTSSTSLTKLEPALKASAPEFKPQRSATIIGSSAAIPSTAGLLEVSMMHNRSTY